ncbi:putative peptidoglycan lipid II flippase [Parafannyhessea umbonata]|uniref:Putative peptidoglycan lipid II flippase n=2 Tax=Parafannyhessea umbonata TaxID=604330 RepID=A0A1H9QWM1_9ACTN|nr:putative peptidoglycan lipid II flippase [Parafannyhessea umbonata]
MGAPKHMRRTTAAASRAIPPVVASPKDRRVVEAKSASAAGPDAVQGDEQMGAATRQAVGRSAALMSALVVVSRITGFARTWAQAYALGVTALASAYTVANNMPNQLYELVAGGMIMTAFLPVYMSVKKRAGSQGSTDYASNLLSIVTLLMGILTVVSFALAEWIIWTQSFSASADFDAQMSTYFFRFFVIEVVLYAMSSIVSGILNAERDYLWSNAAPIFNNLICIASFLLYALFRESSPMLGILALAVGNPLGVLVQVVMQLPALSRHGIRLHARIDWHDPALRETLTIGVPTLVVTVASFPTVAVQTSSALQVTAAGASVAYYARLWYMLPYSVFAVPLTVAMFTELSDYASNGDMESFKRGIRFGTERIVFLLVPFAMFLVIFSPCLITLLAGGKFDAQGLDDTIVYLTWLATALPFYGISTYIQKICSSLRRMNFFAVATVIAAAVQVAFCFLTTDILGLPGVAFSSTLFFAAVDVVSFLHIRKQIGALGLRSMFFSFVRSLVLGALGCAVAMGIFLLLQATIGSWSGSLLRSLIYCVCAGIPAVAVTFGGAVLLRFPEGEAVGSLLSRFSRR